MWPGVVTPCAPGALCCHCPYFSPASAIRELNGSVCFHEFRDESERWGQTSGAIVQLIEQEHAVAIITPANGNIAHQAEQIANKIGTRSSLFRATRPPRASIFPGYFGWGPAMLIRQG
jgi:hypothetical protein